MYPQQDSVFLSVNMSQGLSPAVPETCAIDAARAVVEWVDANGQKQYLHHPGDDASRYVTLDVQFDASTNAALLKIRAPLAFKGLPKRTPLYLYVQGDAITSLNHDVPDAWPEIVTSTLGPAPHRLQLSLARPAYLIAPHLSMVPKNKFHGDMIDSLKLLAQETLFTIYFAHPSLSSSALEAVSSAAPARLLKPVQEATDLRGLYGARGGVILQGSDLRLPSKGPSLPAYDEISPAKSATPMDSCKKRPFGNKTSPSSRC